MPGPAAGHEGRQRVADAALDDAEWDPPPRFRASGSTPKDVGNSPKQPPPQARRSESIFSSERPGLVLTIAPRQSRAGFIPSGG